MARDTADCPQDVVTVSFFTRQVWRLQVTSPSSRRDVCVNPWPRGGPYCCRQTLITLYTFNTHFTRAWNWFELKKCLLHFIARATKHQSFEGPSMVDGMVCFTSWFGSYAVADLCDHFNWNPFSDNKRNECHSVQPRKIRTTPRKFCWFARKTSAGSEFARWKGA